MSIFFLHLIWFIVSCLPTDSERCRHSNSDISQSASISTGTGDTSLTRLSELNFSSNPAAVNETRYSYSSSNSYLYNLTVERRLGSRDNRQMKSKLSDDECSRLCECYGIVPSLSIGNCVDGKYWKDACGWRLYPSCQAKSEIRSKSQNINIRATDKNTNLRLPKYKDVCDSVFLSYQYENKKPDEKNKNNRKKELIVITFINKASGLFNSLINSTGENNIKLFVFGYNFHSSRKKNTFLGMKLVVLYEFLNRCLTHQKLSDDQIIMFLDGSDTVIQLPGDDIIHKYESQFMGKFVMSAEESMMPHSPYIESSYKKTYPTKLNGKKRDGFQYLHVNTGAWISQASVAQIFLRKWILSSGIYRKRNRINQPKDIPFEYNSLMNDVLFTNEFSTKLPPVLQTNDQETATLMYVNEYNNDLGKYFILDHDATFFMSMRSNPKVIKNHDGSKIQNGSGNGDRSLKGRVYNSLIPQHTKHPPAVLHYNGMSKAWLCSSPAYKKALEFSMHKNDLNLSNVEWYDVFFQKLDVDQSDLYHSQPNKNACRTKCKKCD